MQSNEAAITSIQFRTGNSGEDRGEQKIEDRCYRDWDASDVAMWLTNTLKLQ
jgi:hypothetical protein